MNIHEAFPYKVFISRKEREDRREALLPRLESAGLGDAMWFRAIEWSALKEDTRGFLSIQKRACAIGKRLVLRQAGHHRAPSLLFLEDDVVFHRDFAARIQDLQLPEDWGLFYFGCQHIQAPDWVSPGVVRVRRALDMHAVGINSKYFFLVRAAMRGHQKGAQGQLHSDLLLSRLHKVIPTYAAYPNLAWQAKSYSDNTGKVFSYYHDDGRQKWNGHLLSHLAPRIHPLIYRVLTCSPSPPKAAESHDGLTITDVPVDMLKSPEDLSSRARACSIAHAKAIRLFLSTEASHAIIFESETVILQREWLHFTDFDYFQPYADPCDSTPGSDFSIRYDALQESGSHAYIISRRLAGLCLPILEMGNFPDISKLKTNNDLKIGYYVSNAVTRDLNAVSHFREMRNLSGAKVPEQKADRPNSNEITTMTSSSVGASFCTLCKGRRHHLEKTLPENLLAIKDRDAEIVVVDWHSDDGLSEWIAATFANEIKDGILHFYELQDELPFNIPTGKNFAHRFARKEIVLNLDADNYLGNLWEGTQKLEDNEFLVCEEYRRGSFGRIGFNRKHLAELNGYDESFEAAGHQDMDLIKRAVKLGLIKHHWHCDRDPVQHGKEETMAFVGGGSEAQWQAMEQRNRSKSWKNLKAGYLRANASGLTTASFRHNFGAIVSLSIDSYFFNRLAAVV